MKLFFVISFLLYGKYIFAQQIPFGFIRAASPSLPIITESFEQGAGCMTGWTASAANGMCRSSTSYNNLGTYSIELTSWIDYGSGKGVYKAFDLTGYSKIEIDVTHLDTATNIGCLQIYTTAPTSVDPVCSSGILNDSRATTGKLTLTLAGQTGIHYIYIQNYDTYGVASVHFDSLVLSP